MNAKIFISGVIIQLLLICGSNAQFKQPGYGNGEHFNPSEFIKEGSPISILKKNDVTYKLLVTSATDYKILEGDSQKIIDIRKGTLIYPSVGHLVDIFVEDEKICLLLVTSQEYNYVEYVSKFPDAPENDNYLNLKLPCDNDRWKPWRYVGFVPSGMDSLYFVEQIKTIKSIKIESPGNITIQNKEGVLGKYSVTDEHLNLDGKAYTPMKYRYNRILESEFIVEADNMSDEELLKMSKDYIGDDHQINPEMNTMLDSMKNKEAADRIRNRILELHKKSLNQK